MDRTAQTWVVYRDGYRWTPRTTSLARALDLAREGFDSFTGRGYPRSPCEPATVPEGGEIAAVVETGFGSGASYYIVRQVPDGYAVSGACAIIDEAEAALAATQAGLSQVTARCEAAMHRDVGGLPLVIPPPYKSGKRKGAPRWPRNYTSADVFDHQQKVAANEALTAEIAEAQGLVDVAARAVAALQPPPRVVPLSERSDEDLAALRADIDRAARGLSHEGDYRSPKSVLISVDKEIDGRASLRAYGFPIGTRVAVAPLRAQVERGIGVRRGVVEGIEVDRSGYAWSDERFAHRRVVRFNEPYVDPDLGETITRACPSVDLLTQID